MFALVSGMGEKGVARGDYESAGQNNKRKRAASAKRVRLVA